MASLNKDALRAALAAKQKPAPAPVDSLEPEAMPDDVREEMRNGQHDSEPPPREERRIATRPAPVVRREESTLGRTLPHSVEAEMGVLGSLILDPRLVPATVDKVSPAHFYVPAHQTIFSAVIELFSEQGSIDLITLTQHLRDVGHLDAVGGAVFVTSLFTFVPTSANIGYYLEIVREKYVLRELIAAGTEAVRRGFEEQDDVYGLVETFQRRASLLPVVGQQKKGLTVRTLSELFAMEFDEADNYMGDRILAAGQSCTLLGPGGVGKSRLAMQLALCMITGRRFLDLDTHAPDKKWLFIQTENNNRRLHHDLRNMALNLRLTDEVIQRVNKSLYIHTIETDEDAFLNLMDPQLYAKIHALIQEVKPDFIVWDPLNSLTDADLNSDMDMRALVSAISRVTRAGNPNRVPLVLHHSLTGKAGAAKAVGWDKASYGRNSKVLQAWTRAQINLSPRDADDANLLLISCGKNNNGKPFPESGIVFNEAMGLYLKDENFSAEEFREEVGLAKAGKATRFATKFDEHSILEHMEDTERGYQASQLQRRVHGETGMSSGTFYGLWNRLKATRKVRVLESGRWVKT